MLRSEALRILKLPDVHDAEAVRSAFAEAVKRTHPDVGTVGDFNAAYALARAKKARDLLIKRFDDTVLPTCPSCAGKGVIQGLSKFGTTCKTCRGTGVNTRH